MITQKAKYALRALSALAQAEAGEPMMISDIATQQKIPKKFLEQILLDLKHQGIVISRRGKQGAISCASRPRRSPSARFCASSTVRSRHCPVFPSPPIAAARIATASRPAKSAMSSQGLRMSPARFCSRPPSPMLWLCRTKRKSLAFWHRPQWAACSSPASFSIARRARIAAAMKTRDRP